MKKVKIIVGTYGHRKDKTSPVESIGNGYGCNTDVCSVSDEEAARLIKLGVAVEADNTKDGAEEAQAEETAAGNLDAESLEEYSIAELKDLAAKLGLKFKSRVSKDELIKLISSTEVEYPVSENTEDEEADTEEPPVLSAADPE